MSVKLPIVGNFQYSGWPIYRPPGTKGLSYIYIDKKFVLNLVLSIQILDSKSNPGLNPISLS